MKIKTSELTDAALDFAVAKCLGCEPFINTPYDGCSYTDGGRSFVKRYSGVWKEGGPIIDWLIEQGFAHAKADFGLGVKFWRFVDGEPQYAYGPTTLVAAARAFVVFKLGDEVEVPDELV